MKVLEVVKKKFIAGDDGLLRNERMEKEREKQEERREIMKIRGEKGAEKRWQKHSPSISQPLHADSSSSSTSEKDISAEPKDFIKEKNATAPADVERTVPPEDWPRCLGQWHLTLLAP